MAGVQCNRHKNAKKEINRLAKDFNLENNPEVKTLLDCVNEIGYDNAHKKLMLIYNKKY